MITINNHQWMHIVYGPYPVKKRFKQNHKSMSTFVEGPIFECEISGQLLVWLLIIFGQLDMALTVVASWIKRSGSNRASGKSVNPWRKTERFENPLVKTKPWENSPRLAVQEFSLDLHGIFHRRCKSPSCSSSVWRWLRRHWTLESV